MTAAKHTEDQGLFVDTEARHYGISSLLKEPFDPSEGLVVQYEAALQEGLECGGAYLKFLNTDEKASSAARNLRYAPPHSSPSWSVASFCNTKPSEGSKGDARREETP